MLDNAEISGRIRGSKERTMKTAQAIEMICEWECVDCDYTTEWSYLDLVQLGSPVCQNRECESYDCEMVLAVKHTH